MVCVLLLVAFICQPTLIYGLRGSHNSATAATNTHGDRDLVYHQRNIKTFGGKVKRSRSHLPHASAVEQANAKLVMAMESGDVLVRRAVRGANVEGGDDSATNVDAAAVGGGKRNKNGNNNNKKLNKSSDASNGGRKQDKKFSAAIDGQAQQQQHHGSGNGNGNASGNSSGNGKGRQRQQLRSQQHQGHGKRGGGGNGSGSGGKVRMESVEKTSTSEKSRKL